ncbi:alpha/beta fold hydrolase [bacterium]|nr:alpha/beta fold hydrolase [bacterium]
MKLKRGLFWPLVIILTLIVTFLYWPEKSPLTSMARRPSPAPAVISDPLAGLPDYLVQLTIPALRARDYHSSLQLGPDLEQTARYTAYQAWYDSDGARVYGLLSVPTGEMPEDGWPAVILLHGYIPPWQYETNGRAYRAWWQGLAATGEFVVFKPDLRGHGQSQGEATGPYFGSDYVEDALNARAALAGWPQINANAIGLWGHSMSGNTALRAYAAHPEIPAIALWAGAVYTYQDFLDYGINDPSYRPDPDPSPTPTLDASLAGRLFSRREAMDFSDPFWQAMIPANYLAALPTSSGAIGLFHAQDDSVCDYRYSQGLNNLLDDTQIAHEYHLYPNGGHNMTGNTFNQAINDTRQFFKKYLIDSQKVPNATASASLESL